MNAFLLVVVGISTVLGLYFVLVRCASDSIAEKKYMLKCAKERLAMIKDENSAIAKYTRKEIKALEIEIENHWAKRFYRENASSFEFIPTPEEDPDGTITNAILGKKRRRIVTRFTK